MDNEINGFVFLFDLSPPLFRNLGRRIRILKISKNKNHSFVNYH